MVDKALSPCYHSLSKAKAGLAPASSLSFPGHSLFHAACTDNTCRGDKYTDSGQTPYGTSKAYIIMFSRELATRLADKNIKVFAVQPGGCWHTCDSVA
jgi:NAD(P)-dependent dehydrogenase (short-subunit alcohol dehydrogenase family)